jgi:hypothetical protein
MSKQTFIEGHELEKIRMENAFLGRVLGRLVSGINNLAQNAGLSPVGKTITPPKIGAISVKASGEIVHATIFDPQATKTREYFIEASTEPNFLYPHVFHLVSGRGAFIHLPSKTDSGSAQPWYVRGYSQDPGSDPSEPVYYGGATAQSITLSGTTQLTPLQSTGSGSASPFGGQGGWGRGKVFQNRAIGAPRKVGSG